MNSKHQNQKKPMEQKLNDELNQCKAESNSKTDRIKLLEKELEERKNICYVFVILILAIWIYVHIFHYMPKMESLNNEIRTENFHQKLIGEKLIEKLHDLQQLLDKKIEENKEILLIIEHSSKKTKQIN